MSHEADSASVPPEASEAVPEPLPMVSVTAAALEALGAAAGKADEYLAMAKYAKADFINYQDRVRREKADWNRLALTGFVTDLLPALDGFGLARFEDPQLTDAVRVLEKEFVRVLAKYGITPIDTSGKTFDPMLHEAISIVPGGTELEEARRGWMIDGKVLRASAVRIVPKV